MSWFEIFRAGKHTASNGVQKEWTENDLQKIADQYNNQNDDERHEAPIVKGHPADDKPAYGWIDKLRREGKKLFAYAKKLDPGFIKEVKDGHFLKRSAAFYPDLKLKHVGFLGAVPPAVKGMADVNFNSDKKEYEIYTFSDAIDDCGLIANNEKKPNDNSLSQIINLLFKNNGDNMDPLKEFRDALIQEVRAGLSDEVATKIAEMLNKHLPKLTDAVKQPKEGNKDNANDSKKDVPKDKTEQHSSDSKADSIYLEELKKRDAEIENLKSKQRKVEFKEYIDKETNLKGIQKTLAIELMESAHNNDSTIEFSDGTDRAKYSMLDAMKKLLSTYPETVPTNDTVEFADEADDLEKQNEIIANFNERYK